VGQELVGTTDVDHLSETDLGDDGTELSGGSRDTVTGGSVSGGEDLTRDDEGGGVGSEVLEEVGHTVEEDEGLGSSRGGEKLVIRESHDDEDDSQDRETHELQRLSSPEVDDGERAPVTRDQTTESQDDVSDSDVVQVEVDLFGCCSDCWGSEPDGSLIVEEFKPRP